MSTIVAALDASAAARPVLEAAFAFGRLTGAEIRAVHVADESPETLQLLAGQLDGPLALLAGPVEPALLRAIAEPDVVAAVLGARGTPAGRRPVGRTALDVMKRADKPVVVVPPDATSAQVITRVLVPLEGTEVSSAPVLECLAPLFATEVELVVLHVFTEGTTPRLLDRPARDLELRAGEFLARFCPGGSRVEWRTGPVARRVVEVCVEERADLIALSWSQDMSPGRAATIRDVLTDSPVPVLLLPLSTR
jgi:nucleotide-binding universal stress UspA family protein